MTRKADCGRAGLAKSLCKKCRQIHTIPAPEQITPNRKCSVETTPNVRRAISKSYQSRALLTWKCEYFFNNYSDIIIRRHVHFPCSTNNKKSMTTGAGWPPGWHVYFPTTHGHLSPTDLMSFRYNMEWLILAIGERGELLLLPCQVGFSCLHSILLHDSKTWYVPFIKVT